MSKKNAAYTPSMSDDAVKAKTGKTWAAWFSTLDKAGAASLDHKSIARLLVKDYGLPGWWSQNVTVEYERARGLRTRHQTTSGFSVSVTKTIAVDLATLYGATATATKRARWFPPGAFVPSSRTPGKYLNGAWKKSAKACRCPWAA